MNGSASAHSSSVRLIESAHIITIAFRAVLVRPHRRVVSPRIRPISLNQNSFKPIASAHKQVLRRTPSAQQLAHVILIEAYRDRRRDGWVTPSAQVTGMSRVTRGRAARELAGLGLITLDTGSGTRATRAKIVGAE